MKQNYNDQVKQVYEETDFYINEFQKYKDDIYFWMKLVDKLNPKSILEIGIGNGRLIKLLHNKTEKYDGLDFSKTIIEHCKKSVKYKNATFYHQDLKEATIDYKYDLIILPFNVINNFYTKDDLDKAFKNIKKMCHESTFIVIDTINPKLTDLISSGYRKTNIFEYNDEIITVYESKSFDETSLTCMYTKQYRNGNKTIYQCILPNRIFFHPELLLLLDYYGFKIIDKYGDYNFETYTEKSRKQIFVVEGKRE